MQQYVVTHSVTKHCTEHCADSGSNEESLCLSHSQSLCLSVVFTVNASFDCSIIGSFFGTESCSECISDGVSNSDLL